MVTSRIWFTAKQKGELCCLLWDGKHQHPELVLRRSIPRLRPPYERFTSAFADTPCITRGQCGSLLLHRDGLPPSTFCRSPGAPVHSIMNGFMHCNKVGEIRQAVDLPEVDNLQSR